MKTDNKYWEYKRWGKTPTNSLRDKNFLHDMVWCGKCKSFKDISEFTENKSDKTNKGYYDRCKACHNGGRKERYKTDEVYRGNIIQYIRGNKDELLDKLGGMCQRCGYSEFHEGLHLHHVDKETKSFHQINQRAKEERDAEADKTCLLCLPCHFALEKGKWDGEFVKVKYGYRLKSHWLNDKTSQITP